jgi:hypothetical protein
MLKQGAAWKMGPPRSLDVAHVDGGNMKLQMQVGEDRVCGVRGGVKGVEGSTPWLAANGSTEGLHSSAWSAGSAH